MDVTEGLDVHQTQGVGDKGVVAPLGVLVQREMGGVKGDVVFHQEPHPLAVKTGEGQRRPPEDAVMDE